MKTWKRRTHKNRKFCRLNRGKMSKDMFYMSYYQLLHTAYLRTTSDTKDAVKELFVELFGHEPNHWSSDFIDKTETCFANDGVTQSLITEGNIESADLLYQLLIEIGFDVYLLQTAGSVRRPTRKEFYCWLPMKKSLKLKKMVKRFWKKRLPKDKLLFSLYHQLEPYKYEILTVYRKLLLANDTALIKPDKKEAVLAYIAGKLPTETEERECNEAAEQSTVIEDADVTAEGIPDEECQTLETAVEETILIEKSENKDVPTQNETSGCAKIPVKIAEPLVQQMTVQGYSSKCVAKSKKPLTATGCRGFNEKKQMSRKKAVTCAVCVAAAGALLVPLVAYTVIKHKA